MKTLEKTRFLHILLSCFCWTTGTKLIINPSDLYDRGIMDGTAELANKNGVYS